MDKPSSPSPSQSKLSEHSQILDLSQSPFLYRPNLEIGSGSLKKAIFIPEILNLLFLVCSLDFIFATKLTFSFQCSPLVASEEDRSYVGLTLIVQVTPNYPAEVPKVQVFHSSLPL